MAITFFFWGAIFLYITPTKNVPIELLYAEAEVTVSNIERIINELNLSLFGIYLPPKNLSNLTSNLVMIPKNLQSVLPSPKAITNNLFTIEKDGILIAPPGATLCNLFERELNSPFTKMDLKELQRKFPKLLVENMELAENVEIQIKENVILFTIAGSDLFEICRITESQPKTHKLVGCLLSSSIACALAKTVGKPVIKRNETYNDGNKKMSIEYLILEV